MSAASFPPGGARSYLGIPLFAARAVFPFIF